MFRDNRCLVLIMGTMINWHDNSLNFANPVPSYNKLLGRLVLNECSM